MVTVLGWRVVQRLMPGHRVVDVAAVLFGFAEPVMKRSADVV